MYVIVENYNMNENYLPTEKVKRYRFNVKFLRNVVLQKSYYSFLDKIIKTNEEEEKMYNCNCILFVKLHFSKKKKYLTGFKIFKMKIH